VQPLNERELELLTTARRAVLASSRPNGKARLVPITYVLDGDRLYTALDEKPKSVTDPRDLARVQDIERDPRVSVLVDSWSEDWTQLGWLRVEGKARLIGSDGESGPEHASAVRLLRAKYSQYASQDLESRPMIRIELGAARSWFAS
jgi:PPOX class probable F420-dependent enzyme